MRLLCRVVKGWLRGRFVSLRGLVLVYGVMCSSTMLMFVLTPPAQSRSLSKHQITATIDEYDDSDVRPCVPRGCIFLVAQPPDRVYDPSIQDLPTQSRFVCLGFRLLPYLPGSV